MTQTKVSLESFKALRLPGAPSEARLEKLMARLDLDDKGLEKVYAILADAEEKDRVDGNRRMRITLFRELNKERSEAKAGVAALERYIAHLKHISRVFKGSWWLYEEDEKTLRLLKGLVTIRFPRGSDRLKAGRRRQPWIEQARAKLRGLGITKVDCNELLLAVGLSKPRPNKH